MLPRSAPSANRPGFTLVELLLVMVVLGIVLGIGAAGVDRVDPGARGLQEAVATFLESSRDRARATGQPVVVLAEPAAPGQPSRLVRYAFRPVIEANFEASSVQTRSLALEGAASLGAVGRFGAALDLEDGGGAIVDGRARSLPTTHGLSIELHLLTRRDKAAQILDWPGLLSMHQRSGGVLSAEIVSAGDGSSASFRVTSPPGSVLPNRWHQARLVAADGELLLSVDGRLVARADWEGRLEQPDAALYLGDSGGSLVGRIDDVTVWARVQEPGPTFRDDVLARIAAPRLVFDRNGMLDARYHPEGVPVEVVEFGDVVGRFLVGRFSEEEIGL